MMSALPPKADILSKQKILGHFRSGVSRPHVRFPPNTGHFEFMSSRPRLRRVAGERRFINEIPADHPTTNPIQPSCDFLCHIAEFDLDGAWAIEATSSGGVLPSSFFASMAPPTRAQVSISTVRSSE